MPDDTILFTKLTEREVGQAARLRASIVDSGVFSRLGVKFWEVFLEGVVQAPDGIAFAGLGAGDTLAGYAFATTDVDRLHSQILQGRRVALARACVPGLVAHPGLIPAVIKTVLRPQAPDADLLAAQWGTLMVNAAYRRRGVGEMLAHLVSAAFSEREVEVFHSPVWVSNAPSNALHAKLGARVDKVVDLDGLRHNMWKIRAAPLSALLPGHRLSDAPGMPRVRPMASALSPSQAS